MYLAAPDEIENGFDSTPLRSGKRLFFSTEFHAVYIWRASTTEIGERAIAGELRRGSQITNMGGRAPLESDVIIKSKHPWRFTFLVLKCPCRIFFFGPNIRRSRERRSFFFQNKKDILRQVRKTEESEEPNDAHELVHRMALTEKGGICYGS